MYIQPIVTVTVITLASALLLLINHNHIIHRAGHHPFACGLSIGGGGGRAKQQQADRRFGFGGAGASIDVALEKVPDKEAGGDGYGSGVKKKFPITWLRNQYPFNKKKKSKYPQVNKYYQQQDQLYGQHSNQHYDVLDPNPSTWIKLTPPDAAAVAPTPNQAAKQQQEQQQQVPLSFMNHHQLSSPVMSPSQLLVSTNSVTQSPFSQIATNLDQHHQLIQASSPIGQYPLSAGGIAAAAAFAAAAAPPAPPHSILPPLAQQSSLALASTNSNQNDVMQFSSSDQVQMQQHQHQRAPPPPPPPPPHRGRPLNRKPARANRDADKPIIEAASSPEADGYGKGGGFGGVSLNFGNGRSISFGGGQGLTIGTKAGAISIGGNKNPNAEGGEPLASQGSHSDGYSSGGRTISIGGGRGISFGGGGGGSSYESSDASSSSSSDYAKHSSGGGGSGQYSSDNNGYNNNKYYKKNYKPTMSVEMPKKGKTVIHADLDMAPIKVKLHSSPRVKITTGSRDPLEKPSDEELEPEEDIFEPPEPFMKANSTVSGGLNDTSSVNSTSLFDNNSTTTGGGNSTTNQQFLNGTKTYLYGPGYDERQQHYYHGQANGQQFADDYNHHHHHHHHHNNNSLRHYLPAPPGGGGGGGYQHANQFYDANQQQQQQHYNDHHAINQFQPVPTHGLQPPPPPLQAYNPYHAAPQFDHHAQQQPPPDHPDHQHQHFDNHHHLDRPSYHSDQPVSHQHWQEQVDNNNNNNNNINNHHQQQQQHHHHQGDAPMLMPAPSPMMVPPPQQQQQQQPPISAEQPAQPLPGGAMNQLGRPPALAQWRQFSQEAKNNLLRPANHHDSAIDAHHDRFYAHSHRSRPPIDAHLQLQNQQSQQMHGGGDGGGGAHFDEHPYEPIRSLADNLAPMAVTAGSTALATSGGDLNSAQPTSSKQPIWGPIVELPVATSSNGASVNLLESSTMSNNNGSALLRQQNLHLANTRYNIGNEPAVFDADYSSSDNIKSYVMNPMASQQYPIADRAMPPTNYNHYATSGAGTQHAYPEAPEAPQYYEAHQLPAQQQHHQQQSYEHAYHQPSTLPLTHAQAHYNQAQYNHQQHHFVEEPQQQPHQQEHYPSQQHNNQGQYQQHQQQQQHQQSYSSAEKAVSGQSSYVNSNNKQQQHYAQGNANGYKSDNYGDGYNKNDYATKVEKYEPGAHDKRERSKVILFLKPRISIHMANSSTTTKRPKNRQRFLHVINTPIFLNNTGNHTYDDNWMDPDLKDTSGYGHNYGYGNSYGYSKTNNATTTKKPKPKTTTTTTTTSTTVSPDNGDSTTTTTTESSSTTTDATSTLSTDSGSPSTTTESGSSTTTTASANDDESSSSSPSPPLSSSSSTTESSLGNGGNDETSTLEREDDPSSSSTTESSKSSTASSTTEKEDPVSSTTTTTTTTASSSSDKEESASDDDEEIIKPLNGATTSSTTTSTTSTTTVSSVAPKKKNSKSKPATTSTTTTSSTTELPLVPLDEDDDVTELTPTATTASSQSVTGNDQSSVVDIFEMASTSSPIATLQSAATIDPTSLDSSSLSDSLSSSLSSTSDSAPEDSTTASSSTTSTTTTTTTSVAPPVMMRRAMTNKPLAPTQQPQKQLQQLAKISSATKLAKLTATNQINNKGEKKSNTQQQVKQVKQQQQQQQQQQAKKAQTLKKPPTTTSTTSTTTTTTTTTEPTPTTTATEQTPESTTTSTFVSSNNEDAAISETTTTATAATVSDSLADSNDSATQVNNLPDFPDSSSGLSPFAQPPSSSTTTVLSQIANSNSKLFREMVANVDPGVTSSLSSLMDTSTMSLDDINNNNKQAALQTLKQQAKTDLIQSVNAQSLANDIQDKSSSIINDAAKSALGSGLEVASNAVQAAKAPLNELNDESISETTTTPVNVVPTASETISSPVSSSQQPMLLNEELIDKLMRNKTLVSLMSNQLMKVMNTNGDKTFNNDEKMALVRSVFDQMMEKKVDFSSNNVRLAVKTVSSSYKEVLKKSINSSPAMLNSGGATGGKTKSIRSSPQNRSKSNSFGQRVQTDIDSYTEASSNIRSSRSSKSIKAINTALKLSGSGNRKLSSSSHNENPIVVVLLPQEKAR